MCQNKCLRKADRNRLKKFSKYLYTIYIHTHIYKTIYRQKGQTEIKLFTPALLRRYTLIYSIVYMFYVHYPCLRIHIYIFCSPYRHNMYQNNVDIDNVCISICLCTHNKVENPLYLSIPDSSRKTHISMYVWKIFAVVM